VLVLRRKPDCTRFVVCELRSIDAFRVFMIGFLPGRAGGLALLSGLDECTLSTLKRAIADFVGLRYPVERARLALLRKVLKHCGWGRFE